MASRGILFAALTALVGSTFVQACRRGPAPEQLATVDSLKTAMLAASLTLNELDVHHYAAADSILGATRGLFLQRFADTLDRPTATVLGEQFVRLRAASGMSIDHRNVQAAIDSAVMRTIALHEDLAHGAIDPEEGRKAFLNEQRSGFALDSLVQHVIVNYRSIRRALDLQATVDSLLTDTLIPRPVR